MPYLCTTLKTSYSHYYTYISGQLDILPQNATSIELIYSPCLCIIYVHRTYRNDTTQSDTLIKFRTTEKKQNELIIKIVSDISLAALSISVQSNCVVFVRRRMFFFVFAYCHINQWITNYTFIHSKEFARDRCTSVL